MELYSSEVVTVVTPTNLVCWNLLVKAVRKHKFILIIGMEYFVMCKEINSTYKT